MPGLLKLEHEQTLNTRPTCDSRLKVDKRKECVKHSRETMQFWTASSYVESYEQWSRRRLYGSSLELGEARFTACMGTGA